MRGIEFYTTHFLICGNIDGKEKRGCKPSFSAKIHIERKDFIMKKTINKSEIIYLCIWIAFLIGVFIVVEKISTAPTYQSIFKIFQNIFKSM